MSSLAASRADNFYFPPEWTPEMGGLSKYQGSKGANQYQQYGIVRFELPFDGWCLKCDRHICKGHRFNAKKEKVGKYFTTTLYSFATKCPSVTCDQKFLIKTDPENRTYDFAEGLRAMVQDFTPGADDSIIETTKEETKILLENDPMFKLQHDTVGKQKADAAKTALERLIDVQNDQFKNDFDSNSLLRRKNRDRKHRHIELEREGISRGLGIPLVEPSSSDVLGAKKAVFRTQKPNSFQTSERLKLTGLIGESIFKKPETAGRSKRSCIEKKAIGSDAKRARREQAAMKKQAIINLNTKGFTLQASSGSDSGSAGVQIVQVKKSAATTEEQAESRSIAATNVDSPATSFAAMYANYDSD